MSRLREEIEEEEKITNVCTLHTMLDFVKPFTFIYDFTDDYQGVALVTFICVFDGGLWKAAFAKHNISENEWISIYGNQCELVISPEELIYMKSQGYKFDIAEYLTELKDKASQMEAIIQALDGDK